MEIIIDADVIIAGEKGTLDFELWLRSRVQDRPLLAAVTVAELWHGLERATGIHKAKRKAYLAAVAAAVPVLPYTESTAIYHARLWAELASTGRMIGLYDLIVAATALERGIAIATFNGRHFSRVPGLTVIKPTIPGQ